MLTAFISPYREDRQVVRGLVDDGEFLEVYVKCSVETCEKEIRKVYIKRQGMLKLRTLQVLVPHMKNQRIQKLF